MSDFRITNCHIHTFTTKHTPLYFPYRVVAIFRLMPKLVQFLRWVFSFLPWDNVYQFLVRMENFHRTGNRGTQEDVFREVRHYYPGDTRFVVLPMDMELIGHGPVSRGIEKQHDELAELAAKFPENLIPFATVFPDRPNAVDEFTRCIDDLGFRGLKLYNKLGFAPDHRVLMTDVYPICVERDLPVMVHCSRGGVYGKGWSQEDCDRVTAPEAWKPVLGAFPNLRICLAHFGGDRDWHDYIDTGFDPDKPEQRKKNWVWQICDMIRSGDYPGLYTDISYTMFKFSEYSALLRLLLEDDTLREKVLFGSDFYMTRQEQLSEKAVSIRLRDALGEVCFRQIAETNPGVWLGKQDQPPTA